MAINMVCHNSKCKNYWENCCKKNLEETEIEIDEYGKCNSFEEGVCDWYGEEYNSLLEENKRLESENTSLKARLDRAKLPCKVGDKVRAIVYRPCNGRNSTIFGEVSDIQLVVRVMHSGCRHVDFLASDFGQTVSVINEKTEEKLDE